MELIEKYLLDFLWILNEMSLYLLFGFFIAGILYIFFPKSKVEKYLGGKGLMPVVRASVLGVPLPLCSCGVIPTAISFYRNGSSKGSTVSFLISTPQTGVDSILVTWSKFGLPFAIIRPIVAFVTGIFGGYITNKFDREENTPYDAGTCNDSCCSKPKEESKPTVLKMLKYAFVDFLNDISKWLIIGLLLAALISVLIPDNFFLEYSKVPIISMLILLLASVPLYVCATASVPIAAMLIMKGITPGAAFVFLMAGPATNAATMLLIGKTLGKKTLFIYLLSIIAGALLTGLFIDYILPAEWFTTFINGMHHHHEHSFLPEWLKTISSVVLLLLIVNGYLYKKRNERNLKINKNNKSMAIATYKLQGMNCNHCKSNVENHILRIGGIEKAEVFLDKQLLRIEGEEIDSNIIKEKIESLGYTFISKVE